MKFFVVNTPSLHWNTTGITIAGVTNVASIAPDYVDSPWDLVVDWSNKIYITDRYNHRVQKFLMGAKYGTTKAGQMNGSSGSVANQLNQPTGIYVNSDGDIFLSDTVNNRIQRWLNRAASGETLFGNSKTCYEKLRKQTSS
jgi:sugar lactone lactonase YvrE